MWPLGQLVRSHDWTATESTGRALGALHRLFGLVANLDVRNGGFVYYNLSLNFVPDTCHGCCQHTIRLAFEGIQSLAERCCLADPTFRSECTTYI